MAKAAIVLDRRAAAWTLAIEPWAEALEVPADALVKVELYDIEDVEEFFLEVGEEGKFLCFWQRRFDVTIGETVHRFDYS